MRNTDVGEPFLQGLDFVQAVVVDRPVGQRHLEERRVAVAIGILAQIGGKETGKEHGLLIGTVAERVEFTIHGVEHHLVATGVAIGCCKTVGHYPAVVEESGIEHIRRNESGGHAPDRSGVRACHNVGERAIHSVVNAYVFIVVLVVHLVVLRCVQFHFEVPYRLDRGLQRQHLAVSVLMGTVHQCVGGKEVVVAQTIDQPVVVTHNEGRTRHPSVARIHAHDAGRAHVAGQHRTRRVAVLHRERFEPCHHPDGEITHLAQHLGGAGTTHRVWVLGPGNGVLLGFFALLLGHALGVLRRSVVLLLVGVFNKREAVIESLHGAGERRLELRGRVEGAALGGQGLCGTHEVVCGSIGNGCTEKVEVGQLVDRQFPRGIDTLLEFLHGAATGERLAYGLTAFAGVHPAHRLVRALAVALYCKCRLRLISHCKPYSRRQVNCL